MADSKTSSTTGGDKVQLDDFEAGLEAESPSRKVELDLDDAPFLDWDDDEAEEEEAEEELADPEEDEASEEAEAPAWRRRCWWIFLAAATVGTVAALIYALIFGTDIFIEPSTEDAKGGSQAYQEQSSEPIRTDLEPFLVEFATGQGDTAYRYLHFACALYTRDRKVVTELGARRTELREAIFDYFQSKDSLPSSDKRDMAELKRGLLQAVNGCLSESGFDQVMIREYVVY